MSRGIHPLLLTLAMTLSGRAVGVGVGLGDIQVDSALGEPLRAQIEIVGAGAEELAELKAAVASRETFQRYGAERPEFLSSASFTVARDSQGRPILAVRSVQPFTDPLVSLLVDLRWRHGELIREYSLLLDPAGIAEMHRASQPAAVRELEAVDTPGAVDAVSAVGASEAPQPQTAARIAAPKGPQPHAAVTSHRITAKDTLRSIVRHAGARSESHAQRMMIAVFRANPSAFEGNINRLRRGAILIMPSAAAWAAIPPADARREVQAQMAAWHDSAPRVGKTPSSATVRNAGAAPARASSQESPAREPAAETTAALSQRVQTLEQALHDLNGLLAAEHAKLAGIEQHVATAATAARPTAAAPAPQAVPAAVAAWGRLQLIPIAAALGILAVAVAVMRRRRAGEQAHWRDSRRLPDGAESLEESPAEIADPTPVEAPAGAAPKRDESIDTSQDPLPEATMPTPLDPPSTAPPIRTPSGDTTVSLAADTVNLAAADTVSLAADTVNLAAADTVSLAVDTAALECNLPEFDTTAQHVQMPSMLNDHVVVGERRTNIIQVLTTAIEREPHRRDLRLKLLEVYYKAASANRQAMLEIAHTLARERDHLTAEEWERLARMGRDFASDDASFADLSDVDDTLVDCV